MLDLSAPAVCLADHLNREKVARCMADMGNRLQGYSGGQGPAISPLFVVLGALHSLGNYNYKQICTHLTAKKNSLDVGRAGSAEPET